MKETIKAAFGLLFFSIIRVMERALSVCGLYRILLPLAFARAALNNAFKKPKPLPPLPACFHFEPTALLARRQRADFYLNHLIEFFPDRLTEAKWKDRCRVEGFEHVRQARQNGRPIILAACHFGPYYLTRLWLRANDLPVLILFGGEAKASAKLMRFQDRLAPAAEIPIALFQDELRKMAEYLAAGNSIGLMIDTPFGKQMDVPFSEGWTFQMATGAVRMAIRHQAEIIPCTLVDDGDWQFRLIFGRPVPRENLTSESDWTIAGKHLLAEMTPIFAAHPEQCLSDLTRCLKPNRSTASPAAPVHK